MTETFAEWRARADTFIQNYLCAMPNHRGPGLKNLREAMAYSLNAGGKRIRPILALLTAKALGSPIDSILPFATAVEFIHTYSLIHDDLPAMDNDDYRRGKPTVHIVFGEALAILAGDALQAEAFRLLARAYADEPALAVTLIDELAQASGVSGMVGGQAMDTLSRGTDWIPLEVEFLHIMKTGALLRASALGAAHICKAGPEQFAALKSYSEAVGLAFQIADDVLDYLSQDEKNNGACYPRVMGIEASKQACQNAIARATEALQGFDERADGLRDLAQFIYRRLHETA